MPTFLQHRLAREVTLAIAIKLLVIAAIYYAFFDGRALHPDADAVAERLANPNQATQSQPPSGSSHAD
ncbi:MAG: hypothetical protein HY018_07255 [Hydrogenophilales bacterium]|nr:hypothetical protein [Hydrogenophilales bacterium]